MNELRRFTVVLLAVLGVASFAAAQSSTGIMVKGVLTDDSGTPAIPAAFVTLTNPFAGKSRRSRRPTAATRFVGMQPGDYTDLSVTYPGSFNPFSKPVTVAAGGTGDPAHSAFSVGGSRKSRCRARAGSQAVERGARQ